MHLHCSPKREMGTTPGGVDSPRAEKIRNESESVHEDRISRGAEP